MHPPFVIAWSHRAGASAQSFSLSARKCILRLPLSDWFCFGENHGAIKAPTQTRIYLICVCVRANASMRAFA
jgi:hypothetical protein